MFELILNGNNTYKPTNLGNCFFIGYFYDSLAEVYRGSKAAAFISKAITNNDLSALNSISGIYSAIIVEEDKVFVTCDIVNFFPIYFIFTRNRWLISDDWNVLVESKGEFKLNKNEISGFLGAGFTSGFSTLDADIQKTRAGSKIILHEDGRFDSRTIYSFLPKKFFDNDSHKLVSQAEKLFITAGHNLISFLNGRTAVVPLSGGFDSRLIACLLKKHNYSKVICFTYGRQTEEVEISRKTAQILGFEWHFIDYEKIASVDFTKDAEFLNYADSYAGGYSMVYLQEYFAVKHLQENNLIPTDSVFIPGHSGDYIGGSYTNRTALISHKKNKIASFIEHNLYFFRKKNKKEKDNICKNIAKCFEEYPNENLYSKKYNPFVEDWEVKEKFSKFIARSSFVFTYFGYEHIYPFWDRQVVDFWRNIPFELRSGKYLYDKVLIEKFFVDTKVYYGEKEIKTSLLYNKYQKVKDKIRYFLPWSMVYKRMLKNDWLNYGCFTSVMEKELVIKGKRPLKDFKSFNAIICRWYIERLKEKFV